MYLVIHEYWLWLLALLDIVLAVAVTVHAVLRKRDSRSVIAWVGLAWLAPLLGAFAYFGFGINRVQRKATSLKLRDAWQGERCQQLATGLADPDEALASQEPELRGLIALGRRLTGSVIAPGNAVELLVNGDAAYPSMLSAIRGASRSVALLSYIFDYDRVGRQFVDTLAAAHDRGVAVRVLVDAVGARYGRPNIVPVLRSTGLSAAKFLPTVLPYANLRNHRKLLVVDGRIGFTGGTNIREGHSLGLQPRSPVQCLHFRVDGPVVAHLQEAFAIDWSFATGESLTGASWFPDIPGVGSVAARGISDGPDEDFEKMTDVIIAALTVARHRVRIATPYFLPDTSLIRSLCVAALRGVQVEILLPAESNIRLVQWATSAQLWQLLEKGCQVWLAPPPFDHTKLFVVDDAWTLIGSTNWDPRSLRLNFEFNVECYDRELVARLHQHLDAKFASAHSVSLEELNARPLAQKLRDGLARLASPYL